MSRLGKGQAPHLNPVARREHAYCSDLGAGQGRLAPNILLDVGCARVPLSLGRTLVSQDLVGDRRGAGGLIRPTHFWSAPPERRPGSGRGERVTNPIAGERRRYLLSAPRRRRFPLAATPVFKPAAWPNPKRRWASHSWSTQCPGRAPRIPGDIEVRLPPHSKISGAPLPGSSTDCAQGLLT